MPSSAKVLSILLSQELFKCSELKKRGTNLVWAEYGSRVCYVVSRLHIGGEVALHRQEGGDEIRIHHGEKGTDMQ